MSLTFLHGTSTGKLREATDGLRSPYVTDTPERARYYAEQVAEDDGTDPVVLALRDVGPTLLRYDGSAMDEPVLADEETRDRMWDLAAFLHPDWTRRGYLRIPPTEWTWSWAAVGSARVDGIVRHYDVLDAR